LIAAAADDDGLATENLEKYELIALLTAGGQLRTKIYMAASNND
jgi:hypothetical protein